MKITQTESGKLAVIYFECAVTGKKFGYWMNRNSFKILGEWEANGQWIKGMSTSMDLI